MMSSDMVVEEVMIALGTGRCPRCNALILVSFHEGDTDLTCSRCDFRAGLGGL